MIYYSGRKSWGQGIAQNSRWELLRCRQFWNFAALPWRKLGRLRDDGNSVHRGMRCSTTHHPITPVMILHFEIFMYPLPLNSLTLYLASKAWCPWFAPPPCLLDDLQRTKIQVTQRACTRALHNNDPKFLEGGQLVFFYQWDQKCLARCYIFFPPKRVRVKRKQQDKAGREQGYKSHLLFQVRVG